MEFACRLPGKGCNHHSKVLGCTFAHTEAATGLQMPRQAFKRTLVSSRQCMLLLTRQPLRTMNWHIFTLKF
jgi:hypothetical protein